MNRTMVCGLSELLDELEGRESSKIDLWEWVRHVVTIATTESTYGPMNPFKDKDVEEAFW